MHKLPKGQSTENYSIRVAKKKKKKESVLLLLFNENNLRGFWANIKCTNIPIIQVPK